MTDEDRDDLPYCAAGCPKRDPECVHCLQEEQYAELMAETQRRLETTARPDGMEVHTRYGDEGPSHDPYSFTEITVTMPNGREIVYHSGLGEELTVDGERVSFCEDDTCAKFEALVGFPCDQLEWWADAPYRGAPCMACGREGCRGGAWNERRVPDLQGADAGYTARCAEENER